MAIFLGFFLPLILLAGCKERLPEEALITNEPLLGRLGTDRVGVWARTSEPSVFHVEFGTEPGKSPYFTNEIPQVTLSYCSGLTGDLLYSESIKAVI